MQRVPRAGREADLLRGLEERTGERRQIPLLLSRELMEPGIFGVFRPVLIWPERLSERLEDRHIEAILAHELIHARRRDNLTAALHMLVEALFWFHPIVWWMERRMVEERERACDEAVVETASKPGIYAESLLRACRFCVESPRVCVSGITGADLGRRVRSIMAPRLERLTFCGKLAVATFCFTAIAGPVAFGIVRMIPAYGQLLHPSGARPSFAVATIRQSRPDEPWPGRVVQADSFLAKALTLKEIIFYAYGIQFNSELSGGPKWIAGDRFTINAKPDEAQAVALSKLSGDDMDEQMRLRVQSLLADRFKLSVSFQKKVLPVYELVVAKGGLKCAKSAFDSPVAPNMKPRYRGFMLPPACAGIGTANADRCPQRPPRNPNIGMAILVGGERTGVSAGAGWAPGSGQDWHGGPV